MSVLRRKGKVPVVKADAEAHGTTFPNVMAMGMVRTRGLWPSAAIRSP